MTAVHLMSFMLGMGASGAAPPTITASPNQLALGQTNAAIALTGGGTAWTAGTPGSPTFTIVKSPTNDATKVSQSVASATAGTITINAGATKGIITLTDPSTGATTTIGVGQSSSSNLLLLNLMTNGQLLGF